MLGAPMMAHWITLLADPFILVASLGGGAAVLVLAALGKPAKEQRAEEEPEARPALDDDAFYENFYLHTPDPKDIAVRLRRLYAGQLGPPWDKVRPKDNVAEVYDLDFDTPRSSPPFLAA